VELQKRSGFLQGEGAHGDGDCRRVRVGGKRAAEWSGVASR